MPVLLRRRCPPNAPRHLLLFVLLLAPGLAQADGGDGFSVRNIVEEVHDENPTLARDHALILGQREAYLQLMQRLTASADWPRLPRLDDATLQDLVQDVGIDQEKMSSVRLLVTLSVRFKPEAVRHLLRAYGIAYAEWRGHPLVLIPLWQNDQAAVYAESANPWRDLWRGGAARGLVPVLVPSADALDGLTAAALTTPDEGQLAELSQLLASPDILVVLAQTSKNEQGQNKLDLTLTGFGPLAAQMTGQRGYGGDTGDTGDQLLQRAASDLARSLDDSWKSANLLHYDKQGSLLTLAPLKGLEDWLQLRDKLARATAVRDYAVVSLSTREASLDLHYVGEQGQLESVLMQNGLVLSWEDGHWTLRNAGARTR
jgi:hypothetical protein